MNVPLDPPGPAAPMPQNPPADLGFRINPETARIGGEYYLIFYTEFVYKVQVLNIYRLNGFLFLDVRKIPEGEILSYRFYEDNQSINWVRLYTIGHAAPMNVNNNMGQNGGRKRKSSRNRKSRKSRGRK